MKTAKTGKKLVNLRKAGKVKQQPKSIVKSRKVTKKPTVKVKLVRPKKGREALSRQKRAQAKIRKTLWIFGALSLVALVVMAICGVAGWAGKSGMVAYFGGQEGLAKLEKADLERPYFTYANECADRFYGPLKLLWGAPMMVLVFLVKWCWAVVPAVWFSFALAYLIIAAVVTGCLCYMWYKVTLEKDEEKPEADAAKVIQQAEQREREAEEERLADPNKLTSEERAKQLNALLNRKAAQRYGFTKDEDDKEDE